jgi:Glutaminase
VTSLPSWGGGGKRGHARVVATTKAPQTEGIRRRGVTRAWTCWCAHIFRRCVCRMDDARRSPNRTPTAIGRVILGHEKRDRKWVSSTGHRIEPLPRTAKKPSGASRVSRRPWRDDVSTNVDGRGIGRAVRFHGPSPDGRARAAPRVGRARALCVRDGGANSRVYPALEHVPSELFGICVVGVDGAAYAAGYADVEFAVMSVAKPFVFALVCQELGAEEVRRKLA